MYLENYLSRYSPTVFTDEPETKEKRRHPTKRARRWIVEVPRTAGSVAFASCWCDTKSSNTASSVSGLSGRPKTAKQLQWSSGLLFYVFTQH